MLNKTNEAVNTYKHLTVYNINNPGQRRSPRESENTTSSRRDGPRFLRMRAMSKATVNNYSKQTTMSLFLFFDLTSHETLA